MATDARTWFYSVPEPRPYYIEERVNHTLWRNRLQGLFMTCTQVADPIKMVGSWQGMPVEFEWEPGQYFVLRMGEERREMVGVLRQILMMPPAFSYRDGQNRYCVEWHRDAGTVDTRWRSLQGDPNYHTLKLVSKN